MAHFKNHKEIKIALLVYNRKEAMAKTRAEKFGIPTLWFPKTAFENHPEQIVQELKSFEIDFIMLAGFLLLIPGQILEAFSNRILNIHPALLPDFGGKGMYGIHVHKAVRASGHSKSGISIHLADREFDRGKILFQAACPVWESDLESDIAARVLKLEHLHYPIVAEQFILSNNNIKSKAFA